MQAQLRHNSLIWQSTLNRFCNLIFRRFSSRSCSEPAMFVLSCRAHSFWVLCWTKWRRALQSLIPRRGSCSFIQNLSPRRKVGSGGWPGHGKFTNRLGSVARRFFLCFANGKSTNENGHDIMKGNGHNGQWTADNGHNGKRQGGNQRPLFGCLSDDDWWLAGWPFLLLTLAWLGAVWGVPHFII